MGERFGANDSCTELTCPALVDEGRIMAPEDSSRTPRLIGEPMKDVKPRAARHLVIEEEQVREWIEVAVGEWRSSGKPCDGLGAIAGEATEFQTWNGSELTTEEDAIIFRVIGEQYAEEVSSHIEPFVLKAIAPSARMVARERRGNQLPKGLLAPGSRNGRRGGGRGQIYRTGRRREAANAQDELDKLGDGLHLHLFHDAAAMDFNGLFGCAEFGGSLLVEEAAEEALKDFRFTARECIQAAANIGEFCAFFLRAAFLNDGGVDQFQEALLIEGGNNKIKSAGLDGFYAGANGRMTSDKDDRKTRMSFGEEGLSRQATAPGQIEIDDSTRRSVQVCGGRPEMAERGESGKTVTGGQEKMTKGGDGC